LQLEELHLVRKSLRVDLERRAARKRSPRLLEDALLPAAEAPHAVSGQAEQTDAYASSPYHHHGNDNE